MPKIESYTVFNGLSTTGNTFTIDKPYGTQEGDLLLLVYDGRRSITSAEGNFSVLYSGNPAGGYAYDTLWKVAGEEEPDDYTVTVSSSDAFRVAALL